MHGVKRTGVMEIRITFADGPLHGQIAFTDKLDQIKVFFPPRDKQVLVYKRESEAEYRYHHGMSRRMTERYDESVAWFSKVEAPSLRFSADEKGRES